MTDHDLAQIVWDYMRVGQNSKKSELILCLGSHDQSVAERAVELYKENLAPNILFSGGFGRITRYTSAVSEAEMFAALAEESGLPKASILVENKSSNTGENISFSYALLRRRGQLPASMIIVSKPYMERRTLATFEAQWPEPQPKFTCTSPQISFADYCQHIPEERVINLMVGDLQRIRTYPKLGFQSEQQIPDEVWAAFEQLVARGYTEHLLK